MGFENASGHTATGALDADEYEIAGDGIMDDESSVRKRILTRLLAAAGRASTKPVSSTKAPATESPREFRESLEY